MLIYLSLSHVNVSTNQIQAKYVLMHFAVFHGYFKGKDTHKDTLRHHDLKDAVV